APCLGLLAVGANTLPSPPRAELIPAHQALTDLGDVRTIAFRLLDSLTTASGHWISPKTWQVKVFRIRASYSGLRPMSSKHHIAAQQCVMRIARLQKRHASSASRRSVSESE